jgi:signal transduction histidine kinase/CheY-like chemotaxis protein
MKNQLSLRMTLTIGIAMMGVLGVALALYVDATYRTVALDNQRVGLQEILRLRVHDLLGELEKQSRDLGQSVQNDPAFRKNLRQRNLEPANAYLQQHFHQYFVTAGILKLNSLIAHDKKLNYITSVLDDSKDATGRGGIPCQSLHDAARLRRGVERLKVISQLCVTDGYPFMHVLVPIGGLRLIGYLEVVTDPTYTITQIENNLGMPLRISYQNLETAYVSNAWPESDIPEHTILAIYSPKSSHRKPAFNIEVIQNVENYENQLAKTRLILMLTVMGVTFIVGVVMLFFIKKTAVDPLHRLENHLRRTHRESGYLGTTIEPEGNLEVRSLTADLNEMIVELKMLYDELQHANDELKEEIIGREKVEIQLKMNRDHLEELVEQRTADLAVARDSAIRANRSKSQFLANMSHELRTPLNAIIGYVEMLMEDAEDIGDETSQQDLSKIHNAAKHLLVLIRDVLDLSKIEAGKIELELEDINVAQLFEELKQTIYPAINSNNNELIVEYDDSAGVIHADETKLRQTLLNLLSNAAKFTHNGKVHLQAKRFNENDGQKITFSVSDTGIGLTKKEMAKVFDAFTQADSSTTRKYGGTGLGLAISKNFCQLMGGDLTVSSEKGQGSVFSIVMPVSVKVVGESSLKMDLGLDMYDAREQRIGDVKNQEFERRQYISTLLFINEEPILARQFARYFELKGFSTKVASDADAAMSAIAHLHCDVVVMDVELAGAKEWRLMKYIQGHPNINNAKIILLGDRKSAEQGLALGAIDCLPVPTDKPSLHIIINSCVRSQARSSKQFAQ